MKKNIIIILILAFNIYKIFSQCTNCSSNYPSGTFTISPGQTNTVTTCAWGGEYAYYSVVAGNTYTWSTCGDTDFDTQLTLFQGSCEGTVIAYNDDFSGCNYQSQITWTATFTGTVVVLLSKYNCQNYTDACMTLTWSCSGGSGGSQNCNNDNCSTACPFCTGTTYSFPMNTGITAPSGPNYGCLCTQPNPVWYYMLIDQPGNMTIYIQSPTGNDVDFVAWGPFSSLNNICYSQLTANCSGCGSGCPNNTSNPNFYPSGQMVDCSYDPASYEYLHINNAQTGQYYLLCITNYSNQPGTLTFTQSGGNATTNCNIVTCNMQNLTATPSACSPSTNYYSVSGTITFTGAPTTGQLIVTDNSGVSQTFNPPFNSPINYTLNNINSNGAPHTITAYFTAAPTCSLTISYTAPAACNTCSANAGPDQTVCGLTASLNATYGSNTQSYQWSPMAGITFGNIGSPTTSITATSPGSYTLTWNVTTTSGVTCSDQVVINFVNPVAGFTYNNNQCLQGNSFNFTNTGTSSGATYYWTFQSGNPSTSTAQNPTGITWSAAGTYQVTQTVTQGSCTATYTQTITVYPDPTITISSTNATCYGQCNGSATANASGGSSFTYNWNNGSTSQTINGLCAGTYTVTVSNSYGCTKTQSVTITQPSPLNLVTTRTNPTCAGLCNGTANVTVSGGIGPFSYLWSNGATTQNISGLCSGTYTVTVTDNASSGCTSSASVSLNDPTSMTLSTSSVNATCGVNNGSATVTITSGGTPNFSYSWSNGSTTNNTPSTTNTITNIGAGTYTVTVTDANGCTKTAVVNVNSSGAPTATITSSNQPLCYEQCNGSVTVSIGGTLNPPFNYQWSTGSSTNGTTSTTNTINNACAGTITVTITDNLGCSATANISLSQPSQLNANTSTVSANCNQNDGSATVTPTGGTPGYSYQWNSAAGNQTTQTANNLLPGTYTVTVTDANGCTKTASATVGNLPGVTASITSTTNVSCYGGNNGSATAGGTGGTLPYTYQWPASAGNQTAQTAINLQAGTYVVTVTDNNNCTSTATATITQPVQVVASISASTNVSCYSLCDGIATASGSGGTSPYTYLWSNGSNSQSINNLCAGVYTVTVKDANNCTSTSSVTITQPLQLTVTASSNAATCGLPNGSATATASGGTSPYSYTWSNNQNSQSISNLTPGTYYVTITDANNCTAVANTIVGNIPGGSASIVTYTDVSCNGICNGNATATMSGGTPPYSYLWSNGANSQTINNLCAGLYTVTISDQVGCTGTAIVDIKEPLPLSLSFTIQDIVCFSQCNGQISVIASGGTSPYTYLWSNNNNTSSISNLCSGVYSVTVTDVNGCTNTGTRTISDVPPIQISGVTTNANCNQNNGSINITVTQAVPPLTFSWSNGASTEDLNNITAGVYSVTVTDSKGCTATATYTINDISGPTANISIFQNITCYNACNGALTTNVSGGTFPYTYSWSNGQTTQTATNLCAGDYNVTVTDAAGCSTISSLVLNQPPALQINQINKTDPSCNGSCNGSATVIVSGGTPPYSYTWGGGNPFGGTTPNQQTTGGLCNGNLYITVTDANNCTVTGMTFISEPTLVTLIPTSTPVTCAGYNNGTATVMVSGGTSPYSFQWSANAGGQITQTASNLGPGVYSCTVTDANGCTQSMSVTVTSPQPLQFVNVSHTDLPCYMANNGTISVNVNGGTPPYSFNWTNSNGTFSSTTQNLSNLPAQTYFLTVTDANGCSINTTVIVNQPPPLQLSLIKTDETCYQYCNGSIQANPSGGQMPYSYIWSNGVTGQINDSLCPGLYAITVIDNNGCSVTGNTTITGPPLLQISIINIIPATCGQANGEATIGFQGGTTGYNIQWSTGGTTVHETNMPAGNHTVTVIDTNNCVATLNVPIPNLNGPQITNMIEIPVTCAGAHNGSAIVQYQESSPPAPPYVVTWSNGLQGDTITGLQGGLYFVTVQDNNGCVAVGSVVVHEPTNFVSIISSSTHNNCYGQCNGTASVIASGGTQPYFYNWLGLDVTTPNITNLCAGTYTVVCTDANGCSTSNSVTINQPSQISISATINNVKCNGGNDGSIYVYINGGTPSYQYLWQPPIMGTTSVASNLSAGDYSILVTDSWNCTATATFSVTEPDPIQIITGSTPETCNNNNGSAYIQNITGGTSPYYITWSPTNLHTDTITNLTSGVYNLIINDANNCTTIQQVVVEEITPPYYISFTSNNLSCYNSYDGSITVNVQGGADPYTYQWSNGQNTQTAINLSAGYYTVTITDMNGCTIAGGHTIIQPNPITVITHGSDSICAGNNYVNIGAVAIGGTPPYTYLWITPVPNPTAQNQSVSPDTTTTYIVNAYDANGCVSESPGAVTIYVYPPLVVQIPYDYVHLCKGDSYPIQVDVMGGNPPYIYMWSAGSGNPNVVTPFQTTTYYVTVTDQCNSTPITDSMTIYVELPPTIIRPPLVQKGCAPLNAYFDIILDPSSYPVSYLWNFGDPSSGTLNTSTDSIGIHTYNLPGVYPLTLTLTSSFGCYITLNYPDHAQVFAYPSVDFTYEPTENLNPINGDVWFHAITDHSNQVIWLFGDGSSSIGKFDILHSFTQPGIYPVTLIAKNSDGCTDTIVYYIKINEIFTLWAPDAITPGLYTGNAYFYPRGLGIDSSDYYLAIFDRWGNIIFETREMPPATNLSPIEVATIMATNPSWKPGGWNGGFNNDINNLVPAGSYVWYVKVREKDTGYVHERRGIVTVIR